MRNRTVACLAGVLAITVLISASHTEGVRAPKPRQTYTMREAGAPGVAPRGRVNEATLAALLAVMTSAGRPFPRIPQ